VSAANEEGRIKFRQVFRAAAPPRAADLVELREWRDRLRQWELVGEYPGGTGYGNLSHRLPPYGAGGPCRFVVTGTQTGREDYLGRAAYTTVLAFDVEANQVVAEGPVRASSESLTHGVIYEADPALRYVFHAHNPEIWTFRGELGLLETRAGVAYGSPEMAAEVRRLFAETDVGARGIFAMGGHRDGLVSFGRTAIEAGSHLRRTLTRARELTPRFELRAPGRG
jgi:hypothetical protein